MRRGNIFLGLGSNIGDRRHYLRHAVEEIARLPHTEVLNCSSVYESSPVGYSEQRDFLNMVVEITTGFSPPDALAELLKIELRCGRIRRQPWGPRTLDIDILFWGQEIVRAPGLVIPHPRAARRKFVLLPMCEIAPDFRPPPDFVRIADMLGNLTDGHRVELFAPQVMQPVEPSS